MITAVLPGSFDPVTIGHVDLVRRATRAADRVLVAVGVNAHKAAHFPIDQRVEFLREALEDIPRVEVARMDGLLVDFCREHGADLVIKGIRDSADVSWEILQASVNREIGGVETVLLPTSPEMVHVSSSIVRELASWGMDVSRYVPPHVARVMADNGPEGTHRGAAQEGGSDV